MSSPLITIGISTYNRADSYLPQALDSALAQTYPHLEVVVSDNCSSDGTQELVLGRDSSRLRYFRQERNIGPNANFNFCLQAARGDYFLLLHDDDRIDPDMVEDCVTALGDRREVGAIRTGTRLVDGQGRVLSEVRNECEGLSAADLFLSWFDRRTSFYLCSTLYNTARLREHGGFTSPRNLFQDVTALTELVTRYGRVDVPEVKASFRRHEANKGSSDSALDWAEDSLYLLDLLTELLPERAEELREAGLPYLCRKCYRNVRNIVDPVERWRTYLAIYERFGRRYSPWRWSFEQTLAGMKSQLAARLRGDGSKTGSLQPS